MEDIEEIRKKSKVPTHSDHIFVIGVLIAISLAVGLGYGQIEDVKDIGDATPEDIALLRVGFGIAYSLLIAVLLSVPYFFWTLKGISRFLRAVRVQAADDLKKTLSEQDEKDKRQ
jgi:hypothetical protein